MNPSPFDFTEARTAARKASEAQAATEENLRKATKDRAEKERAYRKALATRILKANAVEGIAWSTSGDVARGDDHVAELRYERDVADGIVEALRQAGWRHSADRKDLQRLIAWSERVAPDGQPLETVRSAA